MSKDEDRIGSSCWYKTDYDAKTWKTGKLRAWSTHRTPFSTVKPVAIVEDDITMRCCLVEVDNITFADVP